MKDRRTPLALQPLEAREVPAVIDTVTLLKDLGSSPFGSGSLPSRPVEVGGTVFFRAFGQSSLDLWKTDGTPAGTVRVQSAAGEVFNNPYPLGNVGGVLFFRAGGSTHGEELWRTDGTAAGTFLLKDINPGSASSAIFGITDVGGVAYFAAIDSTFPAPPGATGRELWRSDGTVAGTFLVKDINPGPEWSQPLNITNVGGVLYFGASDGNGYELWRSDGTAAGTALIKDINSVEPNGSEPGQFTPFGGQIYFTANDGVNGFELWRTDGTAAGTTPVADIRPGAAGSYPAELTVLGGVLLFQADDGVSGRELWRTDGTAAGTVLVRDINPGPGDATPPSYPAGKLVTANGVVYFRADDGTTGPELWRTDGTAAGTVLVRDINPGPVGSDPGLLTELGGTLYFAANDGATGRELWRSNGTAAGTVRVADVNPGPGNGFTPFSPFIVAAGDKLILSLDDGVTGAEPYVGTAGPLVVPPPPASPPPPAPPAAPPAAPPVAPPTLVLSQPGSVVVLDPATGRQTTISTPFGSIAANVAVGDLTGDGVADFAFVPSAGGGPVLNIVDGATGQTIVNLFALPSVDFRGGLSVAVGSNAGGPVVAVGAGQGGGPFVRVFDARTMGVAAEFFAFDPSLRTGVNVAMGDVNGDGVDDIIVSTAGGVEGQVKIIDGTKLGMVAASGLILDSALIGSAFVPFAGFTGGLFAAAGNFDGDRFDDVVITPGLGGGPFYTTYRGADLAAGRVSATVRPGLPDASFRGGLGVTVADANGDGVEDVILAPGPGGGPVLFGFDPVTGQQVLATTVGDPNSRTGGTLG